MHSPRKIPSDDFFSLEPSMIEIDSVPLDLPSKKHSLANKHCHSTECVSKFCTPFSYSDEHLQFKGIASDVFLSTTNSTTSIESDTLDLKSKKRSRQRKKKKQEKLNPKKNQKDLKSTKKNNFQSTKSSPLKENFVWRKVSVWMIKNKRDPTKEKAVQWRSWCDHVFALVSTCVNFDVILTHDEFGSKFGYFRFLFAYTVIIIIFGLPMLFMETGLGQFCGRGPGGCWEYAKLFKGIGYAMILFSLVAVLPDIDENIGSMYMVYEFWALSSKRTDSNNDTLAYNNILSESYYRISKKERSLPMEFVLAFLMIWIPILTILLFQIPIRGRIVSCMTIFTMVSSFILTLLCCQLPGSTDGLSYIFSSDTSYNIFDIELWASATERCVLSFSTLCGVAMTFSSYNDFHNHLMGDIFFIAAANLIFSLFGTMITFSVLGNHAYKTGYKLGEEDLVSLNWLIVSTAAEEHLSMVIYLLIIAIVINMGRIVGHTEVVITGVLDILGVQRQKRLLVVLVTFALLFFNSTVYILPEFLTAVRELTHYDMNKEHVLYVGLWMNISIVWFLGVKKFISLLEISVGWNTSPSLSDHRWQKWWNIVWCYISPTCCFIFMFYQIYRDIYEDNHPQDQWARVLGILFWMVVVCLFIGTMSYLLVATDKGSFLQRFVYLTTPTRDWGPVLPENRYLVTMTELDEKWEEIHAKMESKKSMKPTAKTYEDLGRLTI